MSHCPTCLRPLSTSTPPSSEARKVPRQGHLRHQVLEAVVEAGANGANAAEVASILTVPLPQVVAIFSGLAAGDWVIRTSHQRAGLLVFIGSSTALELFAGSDREAA